MNPKSLPQKKNWNLIIFSLILLTIGLLFISVSSISEAVYTAGDKFYFIKKQLLWSGIGIVAFLFFSKIKLEFIKKYSQTFFYGCIILLSALLLPKLSSVTLGARRWLDLGVVGIQPSEILKLASVIFFAKLFSQESKRNIKSLIIYLGIPIVLIILEPNLSTAILISAIVMTIYYLSGGEIKELFTLCLVAALLSSVLVFTSPYRRARLNSLVNSENSDTSYHTNQMILALTSGHWTGKGFANSEQKYRYLPKISTDSILAVIGEETGFVGTASIIFLYIYLILLIVKVARNSSTQFNFLLCMGVACWLSYQSLINISAVVAIIPLTGVPLPLVSYGGSSLVTLMIALGLVQNIQRQNELVYSDKRETAEDHHHHRNPSHSSHRTNSRATAESDF